MISRRATGLELLVHLRRRSRIRLPGRPIVEFIITLAHNHASLRSILIPTPDLRRTLAEPILVRATRERDLLRVLDHIRINGRNRIQTRLVILLARSLSLAGALLPRFRISLCHLSIVTSQLSLVLAHSSSTSSLFASSTHASASPPYPSAPISSANS